MVEIAELKGMEETKNEVLSGSIHRLRELSESLKLLKENIEIAKEKVVIEMGKVGKNYLRLEISDEFWEFEVTNDIKLKHKRVKL